jgi:hypothetical protein
MSHLNMHPLQPNSSAENPEAKPAEKKAGKLQKLRQQRDQLYEEARENPDSDADEMVRTLLLSGILSAQTESDEDAEDAESLRRFRDEARRRHHLAGGRAAEETGAGVLPGRAGAPRAESKVHDAEETLAEVARVASEAAARPTMDATAVYRRIAEIIGLQSPATSVEPVDNVPRAEPGEPKE